eukprot:2227595-Amphidinium_carterae.5
MLLSVLGSCIATVQSALCKADQKPFHASIRQLLPDVHSKEELLLGHLQRRLTAVRFFNINRITGRQLYLREFVFKAMTQLDWRLSASGWNPKRIMSLHGKHWHRLSDTAQAEYNRALQLAREEKNRQQEEATGSKLDAARSAVLLKNFSRQNSMSIAQCKLREVVQFSDVVSMSNMSSLARLALRDRMHASPELLTEGLAREGVVITIELVLDLPEGPLHMRFLYASLVDYSRQPCFCNKKISVARSANNFKGVSVHVCHVVPETSFKAKGIIVSDDAMQHLGHFLQALLSYAKHTQKTQLHRRCERHHRHVQKVIRVIPLGLSICCVGNLWGPVISGSAPSGATTPSTHDAQTIQGQPGGIEDDLGDIFKQLDRVRQEHTSDVEALAEHFRQHVLGGEWEPGERGVQSSKSQQVSIR